MHFMAVEKSYLKDGEFITVKTDAKFSTRYEKEGVPFIIRGYTKGVPFLSKTVHKG